MYNLTGLWAANNTVEQIVTINETSGGWLVGFFIIMLYLSIILYQYKNSMKQSFLVASFIVSIISIFFYAIKVLSRENLVIPIILFFIGIIMYLLIDDD